MMRGSFGSGGMNITENLIGPGETAVADATSGECRTLYLQHAPSGFLSAWDCSFFSSVEILLFNAFVYFLCL
jgi:hypothetical protein